MLVDLPLAPVRRLEIERALAEIEINLPAEAFTAALARGRGRSWRDWETGSL
jgi:hypothetical protein